MEQKVQAIVYLDGKRMFYYYDDEITDCISRVVHHGFVNVGKDISPSSVKTILNIPPKVYDDFENEDGRAIVSINVGLQKDDRDQEIALKLFSALKELVQLKEIKDKEGKTKDYLLRQPYAWSRAKALVDQYKNYKTTA